MASYDSMAWIDDDDGEISETWLFSPQENDNESITAESTAVIERNPSGLPFLPFDRWNPLKSYETSPPTWIHFTIEWKLTLLRLRRTKLTSSTEQHVVVAPGDYWRSTLQPKVEAAAQKKAPADKFAPDEALVVVSVNDRAEDDIEFSFPDCVIDWKKVARQLIKWSHLYRGGKRLKVKLDLIYTPIASKEEAISRQGTKSQHKNLAGEATRERASGISQAWRSVFPLFECPQSDCDFGPWCMVDKMTKKRVRVETGHLQLIKDYVDVGGKIETHDDVPNHIRDLIVSRAEMNAQNKRKAQSTAPPPLTLQMVQPPAVEPPRKRIRRSCKFNEEVIAHSNDLIDMLSDKDWKDNIKLAEQISWEHNITLDQLREQPEKEIAFLKEQGIPRGTAYLWVTHAQLTADEAQ